MSLDIRLPIGLLFIALGGLLTVYGLVSDRAIYHRSLDININFVWGLVMLAFGALMFVFGRRGTGPVVHPPEDEVPGSEAPVH